MPEVGMPRLSEADIRQALGKLPGWELRGNAIERHFEFSSFVEAMKFVNRMATIAEDVNHHPDITINYNKVVLSLTSHDSGGVTERDIAFAGRVNAGGERVAA
jgi:4a-hydroxytetrahydrobiopterin dehydratase